MYDEDNNTEYELKNKYYEAEYYSDKYDYNSIVGALDSITKD